MSENLYQLRYSREMRPGEQVVINGPYDIFGYIIKFTGDRNKDGYLHLVRGTGREQRNR